MAQLIHVNGTSETVNPADEVRGFTLREMYDLLDCELIQIVYVDNGNILVVDEEGKLKQRPVNYEASTHCDFDMIVGPALLCSPGEVK